MKLLCLKREGGGKKWKERKEGRKKERGKEREKEKGKKEKWSVIFHLFFILLRSEKDLIVLKVCISCSVVPGLCNQAPLFMGFSRKDCCGRKPFPSSGESSQPRDRSQVFHIAGRFFTFWATRELITLVLETLFKMATLYIENLITREKMHGHIESLQIFYFFFLCRVCSGLLQD